jgi:hypothetical protein
MRIKCKIFDCFFHQTLLETVPSVSKYFRFEYMEIDA